jgi:hypothetical protein
MLYKGSSKIGFVGACAWFLTLGGASAVAQQLAFPKPPASALASGSSAPAEPLGSMLANVAAPSDSFTNDEAAEAVATGLKGKGKHQGLVLRDSAAGFGAAMTRMSNSLNGAHDAVGSSGFWLEAWTPLAWVQQQASYAAKEYRTMTLEDVDDSMRAPVFRVIAHPDSPSEVSARGAVGTSSVQHLVLRSEDKKIVIQPLEKTVFSEDNKNAFGANFVLGGVIAKFPMDGLRELRGPKGDREFFITVVGATGEEKNFKVKRKHFDELK